MSQNKNKGQMPWKLRGRSTEQDGGEEEVRL